MNAVNEVEIHTRQNVWHFCRYVAKAKLFCLKSFAPVTRVRLQCSYRKIFFLVTDLGNHQPDQPGFSYEYKGKSGEARSKKPSQCSLDRAHMKREALPYLSHFSGSLPGGCRMYLPQGLPAYKRDRGGLRTFRFFALELVPLVGRGEVKQL